MNARSSLFFTSLTLNILFLLLSGLFITKKGGFSYLGTKISNFVIATSQALEVNQPYYLRQTSLFQILPKSKSDIIFLGDSITDECEWAELLKNPQIKNRGISGDTTAGILHRLEDIVKFQPKKIFLMVGINNFIHDKRSPEEVLADYKQIVTTIRDTSPNTEIFIQSVLPVNKTKYGINVNNHSVIKLNLYLKELAEDVSLQYIDLFSELSDSQNQLDSRYTLDGVHLNGQAYLIWKKAIEKYIAD